MKILFAGISSDRSEMELCRYILKSGIELHIACDPSAPAYSIFKELNATLIPVTFRSRIDFRAIRILRQKIQTEHYDIIHAITNRSLSNMLLASHGISVKFLTYRGTMGHLSRLDPASWLTYFHPKVDRIMCVSEAVRQYLLGKDISPSRLVTIHKGHKISWYNYPDQPSLAEFNIPDDAIVVCFSGNMRPVKGIPVLIKAIKYIPESLKIHFLMIGEVRDKTVKKAIKRDLLPTSLHFVGFRKDAPALSAKADIFVMPSISREGLPRAVIEAMANSVPPIVSRVGGMPELVVDKESGIIVPPSDPKALAQAIIYLAENHDVRIKIGAAARKRIQTHFNVETTIQRIMALYDELLLEIRKSI